MVALSLTVVTDNIETDLSDSTQARSMPNLGSA